MTKVTIDINGQSLTAPAGSMIIDVADDAGIRIPRFCYHRKLSVAANCRMCLVEVEKAPKPMPACATPVAEGMRIMTKSAKALAAQKAVMEFLLINHPLDCPICDQGGECELQDVAMGYGSDVSAYSEGKRSVADKDIGPLIQTDMTRCIHCTRCVRFGEEIAGMRELGATGRGEHTEIGTFLQKSVDSELSGNAIDLCPVGALTSKPFRYEARTWELYQAPSIAPHDCVGSNIYLQARRSEILRVVPRENEAVNEVWISDRDRFSYEGIRSADRLQEPMLKTDKNWLPIAWEHAFDQAKQSILDIIAAEGVDAVCGLISPTVSVEEAYLFQKWLKTLGVFNIDYRIKQRDVRDTSAFASYPGMSLSLEALEAQRVILIVGGVLRKSQPLFAHRIRKASLHGAQVFSVYHEELSYHFDLDGQAKVHGFDYVSWLKKLACSLSTLGVSFDVPLNFEGAATNDAMDKIAKALLLQTEKTIVLGTEIEAHPDLSQIRAWASIIAKATGASFVLLTDGPNSAGCHLAGCIQPTSNKLIQEAKAYILMGFEPESDVAMSQILTQHLKRAHFVLALTAYGSDEIKSLAHMMLPIAAFGEYSGSFVNVEGRLQSFQAGVKPFAESRPGWKVLRVLANWFEMEGFDFNTQEEVKNAFVSEVLWEQGDFSYRGVISNTEPSEIDVLKVWSMYQSDSVVRRAQPLQQTRDAQVPEIRISPDVMGRLELGEASKVILQQGRYVGSGSFTISVDPKLAEHTMMLFASRKTSCFDMGPMKITKAD